MNLKRTAAPESESLTLAEVKTHLRIAGQDDDDAMNKFITAIREKTEQYLGQTLFTSTWQLKLDAFSAEIDLPMYPVQSITSVSYVDTDGNNQSFTDHQFDEAGRFKPSYGNSWPSTRDQYDAVTITYVAGQVLVADVTEDIKHAMKLWIGACDVGREDIVIGTIIAKLPESAKDLLEPYHRWHL